MRDPSSPEKAIEWINVQVERLSELRNAGTRDPSFREWRQNTLTIVQRIWPDIPNRSVRFRRIPFSPSSTRATDHEVRVAYERGCGEARRMLKLWVSELETHGFVSAGESQKSDDDFDAPAPAPAPRSAGPRPAPPPSRPSATSRPSSRPGSGDAGRSRKGKPRLKEMLGFDDLAPRADSQREGPSRAPEPPPSRLVPPEFDPPSPRDPRALGIEPLGSLSDAPREPRDAGPPNRRRRPEPEPDRSEPRPSPPAPPERGAPVPPLVIERVTRPHPPAIGASSGVGEHGAASRIIDLSPPNVPTGPPSAHPGPPSAHPSPPSVPPGPPGAPILTAPSSHAASGPAPAAATADAAPPGPAAPAPVPAPGAFTQARGSAHATGASAADGEVTVAAPAPPAARGPLLAPPSASPSTAAAPAPEVAGVDPDALAQSIADAVRRAMDDLLPRVSAPAATPPPAPVPTIHPVVASTPEPEEPLSLVPVTPGRETEFARPSSFATPAARILAKMAAEVDRHGVPEGRRARVRAELMDLARNLDVGPTSWSILHDAVVLAMEYPLLARRIVPILIPYMDEAA